MKYTILVSGDPVYSGNSESDFLDTLEEFVYTYVFQQNIIVVVRLGSISG